LSEIAIRRFIGGSATANASRIYDRVPSASVLRFLDSRDVRHQVRARIWDDVRSQLAAFTSNAYGSGARPIANEAANSVQRWLEELTQLGRGAESVIIEATGMSSGGALVILTDARSDRQFSIRFAGDGTFFMASGVYGNLRSELFPESRATPESALIWLRD
jgi:hypothetical protein